MTLVLYPERTGKVTLKTNFKNIYKKLETTAEIWKHTSEAIAQNSVLFHDCTLTKAWQTENLHSKLQTKPFKQGDQESVRSEQLPKEAASPSSVKGRDP